MKITIEIELKPDEMPLATELINTLRLISDEIKTKTVTKAVNTQQPLQTGAQFIGGGSNTNSFLANPNSGNGLLRAENFSLNLNFGNYNTPQQQQQTTTGNTPGVGVGVGVVGSTSPLTVLSNNSGSSLPGTPPTTGLNKLMVFQEVFARLDDPLQLEEVAKQLHSVFQVYANSYSQQGLGPDFFDASLLQDFFAAFVSVVFSTEQVVKQKPIAPYIYLLQRIPDPYKFKVRDLLIAKILKILTMKRTVDCNRAEFFAYAEAFAALVKLEFVSVSGALTTMSTLVQKAENRAAAITMLGKTVELCLDILLQKSDTQSLNNLRQALEAIKDPIFSYDIEYIKEHMGWNNTPNGNLPQPGTIGSTQGPNTSQQAGLSQQDMSQASRVFMFSQQGQSQPVQQSPFFAFNGTKK